VVGAEKGEWGSSAVVKTQRRVDIISGGGSGKRGVGIISGGESAKGEWKSSAVVEAKMEVSVDHQRWWKRKRGVDIISGGGSAKGSGHHQRWWKCKGK
jgi:hypothetical protein